MLLFAQEADTTGRTITATIIALLLVAALLGLLTLWYWRHTDPRKRLAARRREMSREQRDQDDALAAPRGRTAVAPAVTSAANETSAAESVILGGSDAALEVDDDLEQDEDADEWLRLTSPQQRLR